MSPLSSPGVILLKKYSTPRKGIALTPKIKSTHRHHMTFEVEGLMKSVCKFLTKCWWSEKIGSKNASLTGLFREQIFSRCIVCWENKLNYPSGYSYLSIIFILYLLTQTVKWTRKYDNVAFHTTTLMYPSKLFERRSKTTAFPPLAFSCLLRTRPWNL